MSDSKAPLSYRDAGVDIDAGNELVKRIAPVAKRTARPEVLGGLGGFGAMCRIPAGYEKPVLVAGTDGVGTKLRLALETGRHDHIGIDLVAMCVNDLIVGGAEPLFFLDYYATGHLNVEVATRVVTGIAAGCEQSGCALVGGETAEMPGMYEGEDYDLAGFCVGVVEEDNIIDGRRVQPGDVLIALPSSGAHSNGYSLIRKIIARENLEGVTVDGRPILDALMEPTRIYVKPILALLKDVQVNAMAHITGGGLPENLPRVLPDNVQATIDERSWQWPELFRWLQQKGQVDTFEMYRTFNCGIGMVLVVPASQAEAALEHLNAAGLAPWTLGHIEPATGPSSVVFTGN